MAVVHQATANVVGIMDALFEHGGWMTTTEVADRADVHRDTARKVLAELRLYDWVTHTEVDSQSRWRMGRALPEMGVAYHQRIVAQMAALERESAELVAGARRRAEELV